MIATYTPERRKTLQAAFAHVLTPAQHTMVRELVRLEYPRGPEPRTEDMLYWIRLSMPRAAARVDAFLHPRD